MGSDRRRLAADPYSKLAAIAERELEIVTAGRLDELFSLYEERQVAVDAMPDRPPASARPALERAAAFQARTTAALARGMREVAGELDRIDRGRSTVRAYGAPATAVAAPLKRVDQAA